MRELNGTPACSRAAAACVRLSAADRTAALHPLARRQRRQGLMLQHDAVPAVRPRGKRRRALWQPGQHRSAALVPPQPAVPPAAPCPSPLRQPQIVVLGNLLPAQQEADDLDSYMYQTVGAALRVQHGGGQCKRAAGSSNGWWCVQLWLSCIHHLPPCSPVTHLCRPSPILPCSTHVTHLPGGAPGHRSLRAVHAPAALPPPHHRRVGRPAAGVRGHRGCAEGRAGVMSGWRVAYSWRACPA